MTVWKDISTFDPEEMRWKQILVMGQDGVAIAFWDEDENEFITDLRGKGNSQIVYGPIKWTEIPE